MLKHDVHQELAGALQKFAFSVLESEREVSLEISCTLNKGLFYSDILLIIGKALRSDPKLYLSKLVSYFENLDWSVIEEKGYAYLTPRRISLLAGTFSFDKSSFAESSKEVDILLAPASTHVEINYLRMNQLAFLYSILAKYYNLDVRFYRISDQQNLQLIAADDLRFQQSNSIFAQNNLKSFLGVIKTVNFEGWVLGFHSQERELYHAIQQANSKGAKLNLRALPKTWEIQEGQVPGSISFWSLFRSFPYAASLHLAQDLPAHYLDEFIIVTAEQANLAYFIENVKARMNQVFSEYKSVNFGEISFKDIDSATELRLLYLRLWAMPFHFQAAVLKLRVTDFLSMLRQFLEDFQFFFNSPTLRQKAQNNSLTSAEKEIISAVYGLLNLCDICLFNC